MVTHKKFFRIFLGLLFSAASVFIPVIEARASVLTEQSRAPTKLLMNFSKVFTPDTIGIGATSTLTFNITNPNPTPDSNIAFTDTLPSGVFIAAPPNVTTTCGDAVLSAPEGGRDISFSDGRLGSSSSCLVTVDVTSNVTGTHTNISGDLISDGGNSGSATANLIVAADRPGFSKSFSPSSVLLGQRSRLTFIIDNSINPENAISLNFIDNLPDNITIADPQNTSVAGCTAGELKADAGADQISYSGGSITAGSMCTISVDVVASMPATYINESGELNSWVSFVSRYSGKATAALEVNVDSLALIKAFTENPVAPGDITTLEFTITNYNRSNSASDITFTDDLDAMLAGSVAEGLPLSDPCGAGSQLSGSSLLTLSDGNLAAEASCTFSVAVRMPSNPAADFYTNTTSAISAQVAGDGVTGSPAQDLLLVSPTPILSKTFINNPVAAGGVVTLSFTISNTSPVSELTAITFEDIFFDAIQSATQVPGSGFCGAGSNAIFVPPNASDPAKLTVAGASLAPDSSCTFEVGLNIIAGTLGGSYVNTTNDISAMVGSTQVNGDPASATLEIIAAPRISKSFTNSIVKAGETVTLEFTLSNENSVTATNITFDDNLDAVLSGLVAQGLPLIDPCGAGSQLSGSSLLTLSGGNLDAGATCSFTLTLQVPAAATPGTYTNQTSNVTATVVEMTATGNPASADLTIAGLTLTKSFLDDPVIAGDTVVLEFSIQNASATYSATNITFQDDLNAGLAGLNALDVPKTEICGTGSQIIGLSGNTNLILIGGTLEPETDCTFTVTLQVPATTDSNIYENRATAFSATVNETSVVFDNASDTLTVDSDMLSFSKSFLSNSVMPGNSLDLEFNITNTHATQSITNVTFTDDLDALLPGLLAVGLPANDVCGSGSSISGTSQITLTNGTLAPGATCSFSVTLAVPADAPGGSYDNTTSQATGNIGALTVNGVPANDSFKVNALTFSKAFSGPVVVGSTVVLSFTLDNSSSSDAFEQLAFLDDLDAVLPGLVASGLPANDVCGSGSLLNGTSQLALSSGGLDAGASCSFSVTLQVPAIAAPGEHLNTTSALTSGGIEVATPATATLKVEPPPDFNMTFVPNSIAEGETAVLSYTIDNTNSIFDASALDFTNDLPAGLSVASPANASTTCTGGTLTVISGSGSISYNSGTVTAGTSCVVLVKVNPALDGTYINASGDLTSSSGNSGTAADTLYVEPAADLSILKQADPDPVAAGAQLTYTLSISNSGPSAATGVAVTDTLPPSEFTALGNTCGASGTPLVWSVGTLAAGANTSCVITGSLAPGFSDYITNTATVDSAVLDLQPSNNTITTVTWVHDNHFSVGDVALAEGNSGSTWLTFAVTRTDNNVASAVDYQTVDGTAAAGSDYLAAAQTLNFAAGGALVQNVVITVTGDNNFEENETFSLTLSNPLNGTLDDAIGVGTILNDDPYPVVYVDNAIVHENEGTAVVTVSLSALSVRDAAVNYATADNTAVAGDDYTAASGTLTILAGQSHITFTVPILDDALIEGSETISLSLNAPVNASLGAQQTALLLIIDDESEPVIAALDVSAHPDNLMANGLDEATLTVTATDEFGFSSPFAGQIVTLSWTLGFYPDPITVTLNAQGVASTSYTAGNIAGSALITATADNDSTPIFGTTTISLYASVLEGNLWEQQAGYNITYTFVISNVDLVNIQENVIMTGSIPANTILLAVSSGISYTTGGDYGWGYVEASGFSLNPGEVHTLTWTVHPLQWVGEISTQAHASSSTTQLRLALASRIYRVLLPFVYKQY